jgi:hypothetical protein
MGTLQPSRCIVRLGVLRDADQQLSPTGDGRQHRVRDPSVAADLSPTNRAGQPPPIWPSPHGSGSNRTPVRFAVSGQIKIHI